MKIIDLPNWCGLLVLLGWTISTLGCDGSSPKRFSVVGQVVLTNGDAGVLAGHSIELSLQLDPTTRAFATIAPDGSFSLESLQAGALQRGALPGRYRGRIVLSDDDAEQRGKAAAAISAKVLQFDTSDWIVEVPTKEKVVWAIPQN